MITLKNNIERNPFSAFIIDFLQEIYEKKRNMSISPKRILEFHKKNNKYVENASKHTLIHFFSKILRILYNFEILSIIKEKPARYRITEKGIEFINFIKENQKK